MTENVIGESSKTQHVLNATKEYGTLKPIGVEFDANGTSKLVERILVLHEINTHVLHQEPFLVMLYLSVFQHHRP